MSVSLPRTEGRQKKTDDSGPHTQYGEDKRQNTTGFILPCPYLPGRRHFAKPSRIPSLVMEGQMKRYEEEAKGQRNSENLEDKLKSFEISHETILVPQWSSRRDAQSSAPEPEHLGGNVDDSAHDNNDCEEEHSSDKLSSDSRQGSPSSSTEQDFPLLSTIKAGIQPCPTEPPASGKMHGQWEIPLSLHPNDIPTVTLANVMPAHVQACVQVKAIAPQANSETDVSPAAAAAAAQMPQETYDLLADFPALAPPTKPLVIGEVHGYPKTKNAKGKKGFTCLLNPCQESGASHQRREENVPHEVSSICAGDQKSVPDLQPFGLTSHRNSATISCDEEKGQNHETPTVAGTDGVGGNARSWASAAKAGMKQAAAPQEKARPCTFQQIDTINRAKGLAHTEGYLGRFEV
ncbi:uncharacterized protein LOC132991512 [Labrus mixtus]|uniref:uncharacterized protein LOC132991512 n=1 Tax=Labrus mixtus TaxID=508554 RepID=UPI0029C070D3|nr:uncharacterized protein LOC132991512 [Labrus mixtus]